jgi:hypothetical protein
LEKRIAVPAGTAELEKLINDISVGVLDRMFIKKRYEHGLEVFLFWQHLRAEQTFSWDTAK